MLIITFFRLKYDFFNNFLSVLGKKFYIQIGKLTFSITRHLGRVVKAADSKSAGHCPREFKPHRCRFFYILSTVNFFFNFYILKTTNPLWLSW